MAIAVKNKRNRVKLMVICSSLFGMVHAMRNIAPFERWPIDRNRWVAIFCTEKPSLSLAEKYMGYFDGGELGHSFERSDGNEYYFTRILPLDRKLFGEKSSLWKVVFRPGFNKLGREGYWAERFLVKRNMPDKKEK